MSHSAKFLKPIVFLAVLSIATLAGTGQSKSQMSGSQSPKTTLRKIYDEDQENRDDDSRRLLRAKVRQLIAEDKVQTGEDYYYAAFVFQHGQKPEDYLYAHVLATTALGKGFAPAKWLSAATLDRYLRSVKQSQIFGTQFGSLFDEGQLEPYNKDMLSDKMRELWCVAPYSKQLKIVDDMKSGKEFTSTRICPIPD
jgi:hypothetical protein